jgi:uncharacterized protein YaaW (UPF0174 family)
MKTAIQELIEKLSMKNSDSFYALAFYHDNDEIIKEALEKEKEQIADAFRNGSTSSMLGGGHWTQYYNQTYNQSK